MKPLLNTLYITTHGSYLHKERETLVVEQEGEKVFQCPLHALQNVFCFGRVMVSPGLMGMCGERGVGISFFSEYGKFQCRLQGPQSGNVLLRRSQYRLADTEPETLARLFVSAKIANCRNSLLRTQRNSGKSSELQATIRQLAGSLRRLQSAGDVDQIRGIEGDSAARYFTLFNNLITADQQPNFEFNGRSRRPPLDPVNALLSFAYSLLTHELASALQGIGLDPYVGYLHTDRPGRLSLALDMLEEFRCWWCDRFVLSLINRKQFKRLDFIEESSGAWRMKDKSRKKFLSSWQERKQETLIHPYLEEQVSIGMLPTIQANLLARFIRGDLEQYPPFVPK